MEFTARKHYDYDMIRENFFPYRMFNTQKHMCCTERDTTQRRRNIR